MMPPRLPQRGIAIAITALFAATAIAETTAAPQRLSERLSNLPPADGTATGLRWLLPEEHRTQAEQKHLLLAALADGRDDPAAAAARGHIEALLKALPVSGRVALPAQDYRWLQAHPKLDPILQDHHQLSLAPLPTTVTVLSSQGSLCTLPHRAGADVLDYVAACRGTHPERVDQAWIAQPDGFVSEARLGNWNRTPGDEAAPGSWIWAPENDAGWPDDFSSALAQFLATQTPVSLPWLSKLAQPQTVPHDWLRPQVDEPVVPSRAEVAYAPPVSANDWGLTGLLQTPSARVGNLGQVRMNVSHVQPYTRINVIMQPLEFLEAGFRYTDIGNRLYSTIIAGNQSYKDKSVDLKVRLQRESASAPEIAIGLSDFGGTGLFSSEYLVASKRTGDFDWSLGVAWGYLGARGNLPNPLRLFGSSFNTRPITNTNDSAGKFNFGALFRGRPGLIGGVDYRTSIPGLSLKLELDGNDYRNEPLENAFNARSPFNFGAVYRPYNWLELSAGVERGNRLQIGVTAQTEIQRLATPKLLDPAPTPISWERPTRNREWDDAVADIEKRTQWPVARISVAQQELRLVFRNADGFYLRERIERATAILHQFAPAHISSFVFVANERGSSMTEWVVLRDAWAKQNTRFLPPSAQEQAIVRRRPYNADAGSDIVWASRPKAFEWSLVPNYRQSLGGPDAFLLYQLGFGTPMEYRFSDSTWLSGSAELRALDNYANFKYTAPSALPRVRTFAREFLTTSRFTLPNLQLNHVGMAGRDSFYSVYGGLLESMFAGVGFEWLYRPWNDRVAFGIDINRVQQRDFDQHFALRDYKVTTGHATFYWDTRWNDVRVNASIGQYLAGDRGVTVDVGRYFRNGAVIGAYATKTNVSSLQFGEGSFDKGIYVRVPLDAILAYSSKSVGNFVWTPLTRDGGAKLDRTLSLYDLSSSRDQAGGWFRSASREEGSTDDEPNDQALSAWGDLGASASFLKQRIYAPGTSSALAAGALLTAASSLLDRPVARFVDQHQGGKFDKLGSAASGLPMAMTLGTGLLATQFAGAAAADTAKTALYAGGFALAANAGLRFMSGRARPDEEQGSRHFSGPSRSSVNSSLGSNHSALAFALVTPFAQRYDAPWLYWLAAATALGRIQQRQHFVSDTVAGGLIGYGMADTLLERRKSSSGTWSVGVQNQTLFATRDF